MSTATSAFDQRPARVRTDWGLSGALALTATGARSSLVVVIDVLSFSTSVTVACEQGSGVYPFPYHDPAGAARLARTMRAALAGPRWEQGLSISPASLMDLDAERLVLPAPNPSTICHTIASRGALVIVGCLRNATAVAGLAAAHLAANDAHDVVLVPAGERWPDDTLRPALEDNLAAGAIAARLADMMDDDVTRLSPETAAAVTLWRGTNDAADTIGGAGSGRELIETGFVDDVTIASDVDSTDVVPVLVDGAFVPLGHRIAVARAARQAVPA
ncbi:2-phosphosulfolactate phosphatase [Antribacter gilvus]|uniref:2-phosphosulfolactate phosphatase n=1 Tax=Antribacter gilvus TaxID=2304675 RepID=UPI0013DF252C|nr:2-phosphosulfolactate phosphatase [Antribacter gilvus]